MAKKRKVAKTHSVPSAAKRPAHATTPVRQIETPQRRPLLLALSLLLLGVWLLTLGALAIWS